jgi:hypothetical protein
MNALGLLRLFAPALLAATCLAPLAACAPARRAAPHAALAPPTTPLRVTLLWSDPVDLDLYVTDPRQETVYFANARSDSGGRLERDQACGDHPDFLETVTWHSPPAGRYRVGVDYHGTCGHSRRAVAFRVVVDGRRRREEVTGWLAPAEFRYIVLEFDVEEEHR